MIKLPNFERLFESKKFLRIISLALGILTWLVVVTIVDPSDSITISKVPLTISTVGTIAETNQLEPINQDQQFVSVRVSGKIYEITSLKPEDFKATLEITDNVSVAGTYELNVNVVLVEPNSSINVAPAPGSIQVAFDRRIEKTFPLNASVTNKEAEEGYIIGAYTTSPQELILKGPEAVVNSIASAEIFNNEAMEIKTSTSISGTLIFLDSNGQEVDGSNLVYKDSDFKISIPLYKKETIPLSLNFINVPDGIDTSKLAYTIEPAEVEVGVPVDTIAVDSIALLPEIDFRKLSLDKTLTYDIPLLASYININDAKQATVKFDMTDYGNATLSSENIVITNPPTGYSATAITKKLFDITFVGRKDVLSSISSADVVVTADLSNYKNVTEGEQHVPVRVTLSSENQAWAVGDYSVLISLKKAEALQ